MNDLKFAKQQQWMTTNYLVLVLAAIFGISKAVGFLTVCERLFATLLIVMAFVTGCCVLVILQCHMGRTQERLSSFERPENQYFSDQERKIAHIEEYDRPYVRGASILMVLIGTAFVGALLVGYSVWRSALFAT